jgi:hypothetical protein
MLADVGDSTMFDTSADISWKSGASAIDIRAKMIVEEFRWSYECLWRKSRPSDMGIRAKMIDGVHKKWWAGYEIGWIWVDKSIDGMDWNVFAWV